MSTRAYALSLLDGARESNVQDKAVCDLIATALRRHPDECTGTGRHLLGLAECEMYRRALVVLGIPSDACDNRGPRIGEDGTRCRLPKGHEGAHSVAPDDGFGQVAW